VNFAVELNVSMKLNTRRARNVIKPAETKLVSTNTSVFRNRHALYVNVKTVVTISASTLHAEHVRSKTWKLIMNVLSANWTLTSLKRAIHPHEYLSSLIMKQLLNETKMDLIFILLQ